MYVDEFVVWFYSGLGRIGKLELNEKLKGLLLLPQANIDVHDRNIVIGSAKGNYSVQLITNSLRNAYRSEGLPATSMTSASPSLSQPTHLKSVESAGNNHPSNSTDARTDPLFYTLLSANHDIQTPSGIIDTGACESVVRQDTLDEAMTLLNIKKLGGERINRAKNRFGPNEEPHKTFPAVCVPFLCSDQETEQSSHLM